jgi:hypothetical protein
VAAVLALAVGSCSSPSDDPSAAFVGIYNAYAVVHITDPMSHPLFDQTSTTPTQVFHGAMHEVVLDDGQCLLPGDIVSGAMPPQFSLHLPLTCDRHVETPMGGGTVHLHFTMGSGTLTSQNELQFMASGDFTFMPDAVPDGGMPMGGPNAGNFSIQVNGSRQ